MRERPARRLAFDVFQNQIVWANVVDLANVRMIQRSNRPSFLLKPGAALTFQAFDSDYAVEPRIARFPDVAHAARANGGKNFVRTELRARCQGHEVTILLRSSAGALLL